MKWWIHHWKWIAVRWHVHERWRIELSLLRRRVAWRVSWHIHEERRRVVKRKWEHVRVVRWRLTCHKLF